MSRTGPRQPNRPPRSPGRPPGPRCGGDPGGYLAVGGRDQRVGDEQAQQPPDRDHGGCAGHHEHDAPEQVGPVCQHDGQHDPQDRGHQGGDDHGPDHGGRRVADHPGRGNHRRQRQQEPVAAQPAAAFWALEEQLVAHPLDVDVSQAAHLPFLLPLPGDQGPEPADRAFPPDRLPAGRGPMGSIVAGIADTSQPRTPGMPVRPGAPPADGGSRLAGFCPDAPFRGQPAAPYGPAMAGRRSGSVLARFCRMHAQIHRRQTSVAAIPGR